MNKNQILLMALESGLQTVDVDGEIQTDRLVSFFEAACAVEREACAEACAAVSVPDEITARPARAAFNLATLDCAEAVRSRGTHA